jgi:alkylation response protein AidB-like acyl-CoA dehydrogenase
MPLLASDAAVAAIRRSVIPQQAQHLPAIAAGDTIATLAVLEESDIATAEALATRAETRGSSIVLEGAKLFVPDGQDADCLLVAARDGQGVSLFAVPADTPGVTVTPLVVVDATQPAAALRLDGVTLPATARLGAPGGAWPAIARTLDRMTLGLAAEMVGAADAALAMAVEYAKVRQQFGSPIGRFQGVKHRCPSSLRRRVGAVARLLRGLGRRPRSRASRVYAAMAKPPHRSARPGRRVRADPRRDRLHLGVPRTSSTSAAGSRTSDLVRPTSTTSACWRCNLWHRAERIDAANP